MKKLLTLTLALLIAISSFTTVSFADVVDFNVGLTFKNLSQQVVPGKTFEVLVYADRANTNTYTYQMGVNFNSVYFQFEGATSLVTDSIKGIDIANDGTGDFAFYINGENLVKNDDLNVYNLAILKFKTLKKVDKPLTISIDSTRTTFLDADATELTVGTNNLTMTLPEAPVKVTPKESYFYPGDNLKLSTSTPDAAIYYSSDEDEPKDTLARNGVISLPNKSVGYYLVAVKYGIESEVTHIKLTFRNPASGIGGTGSTTGTSSNKGNSANKGPGGTFVPTTNATTQNNATASKYADIKTHWAKDHINKLIAKNIISGYEDGTVRPDNTVTRAEIAKIIVCALNQKAVNANLTFSDNANVADWAAGYIQAAVNLGILNGYEDGTFRPNQPVTRQELAKIAMVAFKYGESQKALSFNDNGQIPDWSAKYIAAAVENGIITGYEDGTFLPAKNVTRAEACTIISKCLK